MLETNEKNRKLKNRNNRKSQQCKKYIYIKKNKMEMLELENTIAKYKNSMDGLNSRMEERESQ